MHETKDLDSGDLSKVILFLLSLLLQSKWLFFIVKIFKLSDFML